QPEYVYFKRMREAGFRTAVEQDERLRDFYDTYDPFQVTERETEAYKQLLESLSDEEKTLIDKGYHFYELNFENKGGMVMPIILRIKYFDGTETIERIPVQIWQVNTEKVTKLIKSEKEIKEFEIDPYLETTDIDRTNNYWPPRNEPTRFQIIKTQEYRGGGTNPMREAKK
ncbi:MAG: hypothetical protein WCY83_06820, partial [Bacteroidales bacterium]